MAIDDNRCRECGEGTDGLLLCAGCCRDGRGWDRETEEVERARLDYLAEALAEVFAPADTREAA
jgi:hypothetical protein